MANCTEGQEQAQPKGSPFLYLHYTYLSLSFAYSHFGIRVALKGRFCRTPMSKTFCVNWFAEVSGFHPEFQFSCLLWACQIFDMFSQLCPYTYASAAINASPMINFPRCSGFGRPSASNEGLTSILLFWLTYLFKSFCFPGLLRKFVFYNAGSCLQVCMS